MFSIDFSSLEIVSILLKPRTAKLNQKKKNKTKQKNVMNKVRVLL